MVDTRILCGRRVVLTRPLQTSDDLHGLLQKEGAEMIYLPCIRFHSIPLNPERLQKITPGSRLIFTSQVAVGEFFTQVNALNYNLPVDVICFGINDKTTRLLSCHFNGKCCNAKAKDSREFAAGIIENSAKNDAIIHPVSRAADATMEAQLAAAQLSYERLEIYEPVNAVDAKAILLLLQVIPDLLIFYSPSAVAAFSRVVPASCEGLVKSIFCAAIGATTEGALRRDGFAKIITAGQPTTAAILKKIITHFQAQNALHFFEKNNLESDWSLDYE